MQTRFILGPAGSGKTFRCLTEIRHALTAAPDGPPLLLLAPKQTTYQLERQLLAYPSLPGYTRLHILSFDRLAFFIFDRLQKAPPRMLDEEGRLMVLRGLLAKKRNELKLFRASARLTGFAQHLSQALRELQRHQLTPESLAQLAEEVHSVAGLSAKLHDLATLLRDYLDWLAAHQLQDADHLLDFATQTLRAPHPPLDLGELWVDGFNEFSPQELDLLAELLPHTADAMVTFCLDQVPTAKISWLSNWSVVRQTFEKCKQRFAGLPNSVLNTELLPRRINQSRFLNNPVLFHLESHWAAPAPFHEPPNSAISRSLKHCLRVTACANPEAEATLAAREILRFVRAGGRYREITVLARNLQSYHEPLANVFTRYEIPFFLDRRESVSHHPLAELARNALRTVAFSWARDDWFAALKTGLVPAAEVEIDRLENEALARGWSGKAWHQPITIADNPLLATELERVRRQVVPPFYKLAMALGKQPTGTQLAAAMREFWQTLTVVGALEKWSTQEGKPNPVHLTVWEQMNAWMDNVELAFPTEPLPLREWLPVLEAGLAGLTVGVIPPALDQVLIGAIDRSRNPDIRLALVLGMNETVFPAPPQASVLLTDADRTELEHQGISLTTLRQQLSQERFYGYVACTRARQRLVLTRCLADAAGKPLNPSPFLSHFKQLFPALEFEVFPGIKDWRKSEHAGELIAPLLRNQTRSPETKIKDLSRLGDLPALAPLRERLQHLIAVPVKEALSPALAHQLYGPALRTSVSRMEQFAACPFKFFVHSGLRAEERKLFELDVRDQGNFQHEILAEFHDQLKSEKKRWRDITPAEARERIKSIAASRMVSFREGLLQSSEEGKFTARVLTESLQDFTETLIGWMRRQYAFDPTAVELPFGDADNTFPPWDLDLNEGHRLLLHGRIDRIDIHPDANGQDALCVVVDYKSSQKQLDPLLMEHGLQLQLAAYLNVLRHWPNPRPLFGVSRLMPAGVFYVNLRGKYERGDNRDEALGDADAARKLAYRHTGRFDAQTLDLLDQRPEAQEGDQFNYRRKKDGGLNANSREALESGEFMAMLDGVEAALKKMGRAVYGGEAKLSPYRKGTLTACDQCDYRSICRIDPWTHSYRVLRKAEEAAE
ncbi:MAG: helicase-exonuclease AddAB subunit AddB [Pedosphaera sp.]|nr:helicase-exonuclease AddAB subunit AddB [Pedosphaera sp.]